LMCWSTSGGTWNSRHITVDGLERTFALNHLAPFLLTNLLLDRLKHSVPARVVTVASHVHASGRIDFDDLQGAQSYSGARAYNQPSSPTFCSPTNGPGGCRPCPSPPTFCIPA
jgi:NAD(P)-dependent dehydrogenase (short-subunit alcohol dehydrogenase family)